MGVADAALTPTALPVSSKDAVLVEKAAVHTTLATTKPGVTIRPGYVAPIWKRILFFDVDKLIFTGFKRRLETSDCLPISALHTDKLYETFEGALVDETVRVRLLEQERLQKKAAAAAPATGKATAGFELHAAAYAAEKAQMAAATAPPPKPGSRAAKRAKAEAKKNEPKHIDLKRVLIQGNWTPLLFSGVLYGISQACSLAGPLLLNEIVDGLQCFGPDCKSRTTLYYFCIGLFLAPFVQSVCENHQTYLLYLLGTRMRNALMAAIYRKCLRLSNASLQAESTGRIVTLMSNDAQKLQDAMMAIHALWGSPLFIIAVLVLLWYQVGWATFVGLFIMLMITPFTILLAQKLGKLRRDILQWTDKRVGYMNEVINGMQMIKFYAWEPSFKAQVMACRGQEARILKVSAFWQGLFGVLLFAGPLLVAICVFGSYSLAGNNISPSAAYTALSLFSLLRFPMSFLPMLITQIINALVALKRIGSFLDREETDDTMGDGSDAPAGYVSVRKGDFTWHADAATAAADTAAAQKLTDALAPLNAVAATRAPRTSLGADAAARASDMTSAKDESTTTVFPAVPQPTRKGLGLGVLHNFARTLRGGRRRGAGSAAGSPALTPSGTAALPPAAAAVASVADALPSKATGPVAEGVEVTAHVGSTSGMSTVVTAQGPVAEGFDEKAAVNGKGGDGRPQEVRVVVSAVDATSSEGSSSNVMEAGVGETFKRHTLMGLDFEAPPGSLTMIVGSVGSGKSSVLNALIHYITRKAGTVTIGGTVAYVAQTAWIMNDTLQENVLLGAPLDPVRYRMSLEVAQLGPDLDILPNGDLTEIGDRGITLSGGQKQRVSIARAVYADADVYLLDDPLSAVDSHVGRALFEQCIRGALRQKTVILVTNALQYLSSADNILWMEDGLVKAQGTFAQLIESGLSVAELAHADSTEDALEDATEAAAAAHAGPKPEAVKEKTYVDKAGNEIVVKDKITLTRGLVGANKNLTGVEEREEGNLEWRVVQTYFANGGGLPMAAFLLFLFGMEQAARVYCDKWVGIWFSNQYSMPTGFYLGIYFGMGLVYALCTFGRSLSFLFLCVNAAVNLHNKLLIHILRLPKTFFDTNPAGRILNRFSRDTDIMDATLSASLIQFSACVATYVAILVVISIATKWFAIALVPLTIVYFAINRFYIPTARELQRIESVTRSPIYSRFAEAIAGVATIRAYRKQAHFTAASDTLMEDNAYAFVTLKLCSAWLAMRLDLLGLAVLTGTGVLVIAGNIDPAMAGLALVYSLDLTRYLKHGTNMAAKAESDFNSVERIVQYLTPAPEAAADTPAPVAATMDPDWPARGAIVVNKLTMRYRPEMPLVLKGVSFEIGAGEKVGLVGRTGSGKSSMLLVLFRMVEPESGSIIIDGIDIALVGLHHLRSKMSIIPQDPFMFSGTVRKNLDPFDAHTDEELWRSLDMVGLKDVIAALDGKLEAKVVDGGSNFSLGQRQLFCLARAMLRKSKILMLDEATASVDLDTDNALQLAIRTAFSDCTMLTIAHRLNTIMDSDRVIVMDNGLVVENESPAALLQQQNGIFTGMVAQTGRSSARYLKTLANNANDARVRSGAATPAGSLYQGRATGSMQSLADGTGTTGGAGSSVAPSTNTSFTAKQQQQQQQQQQLLIAAATAAAAGGAAGSRFVRSNTGGSGVGLSSAGPSQQPASVTWAPDVEQQQQSGTGSPLRPSPPAAAAGAAGVSSSPQSTLQFRVVPHAAGDGDVEAGNSGGVVDRKL